MKESRRITPLRTILRNCLNHIENLEANPSDCDNYDKEFQNLKQFSETLKVQKDFACTEGEKEVNRKKNRYKDILPFNVSRVVLSEYAGVPGSDYINANFIKGASGSPAYIASQGPLPNTVNDFWRMVVECEVQVIVMACNAQESGKHKCENYWVEKEGEEKRFGMVQISLVKASIVCPDFLVRTMRLKYINDKDITEERTVCQFHYSAWPDHGVPPLVRPLLDMVRLVRDTQASETLPVLVHCSAGCGRTGTICAIDFVWGLLRAGKLTEEFSLFNLVRDMRKQRVAMVQTKEQYILVHQAVRELFKEQLQVIESHPYENIDFNGVPLIKDFEEPFYDTIAGHKEENCDEKQDMSELKEKEDGKTNKTDTAPPLPRKKRPNVLFSKQEKEAENLTEKNRLSFTEKEKEKTDAAFGGLLGKPRIVKLRALFEKNLNAKERATLKDRGNQTVSRSQSLGAIRKPVTSELFDSQCATQKTKPSALPPQPMESIKLKQSKSFSKAVPLVKRSKSLKTFGQPPLMIMSPSTYPERKAVKSYSSKSRDEEYVALNSEETNTKKSPTVGPVDGIFRESDYAMLVVGKLTKENSIRRRSLESLMGDAPPTITWPITVMAAGRNEKLDWTPVYNAHGNGSPDLIGQQLKRLYLESDKNLGTIASSIGTRERRNSFRQAVDKSDFQNFVQDTSKQPSGSKMSLGANHFYVNSVKNFNDVHGEKKNEQKFTEKDASSNARMTVSSGKPVTQDRMLIETSNFQLKSSSCRQPVKGNPVQDAKGSANHHVMDPRMRAIGTGPPGNKSRDELDLSLMSKNLFLRKLNSEILYDQGNKAKPIEQRFREPFDASGSFKSPKNLSLDLKKCQPNNSIQDMDEPDGPKVRLVRPPKIDNIDRVIPIPLWPDSQAKVSKSLGDSGRTSPSRKETCPYQTVVGESSTEDLRRSEGVATGINTRALPHQRKNICYVAPTKGFTEPEALAYNSYCRVVDVTYNSDSVEKKLHSPIKSLIVDNNHKTSFDCLLWQSQAGSSRSSGEGSSSDQLSTKSDSLRLLAHNEGELSSKSDIRTLSKGGQVKMMSRVRSSNSPRTPGYANGVTQKKTDHETTFKVHQNPSRYSKDDFLLTEPIAPPRVKRHASVTIPRTNLSTSDLGSSQEKKMVQSNESNKNTWNESFGIDLDAVAASMKQGNLSVLRNATRTGKNYVSRPSPTGSKKKQHYF